MGYLPPGDDVRRLHHLESRFTPIVHHLVATYPNVRVPLAACQEGVARWFGHPSWHAMVVRQSRAAAKDLRTEVHNVDDEQPWMTTVPIKTLKTFSGTLQNILNRYLDQDRGDVAYWTNGKTISLMAQVMGFPSALALNQAWDARQPRFQPRATWWSRTVALLRATPPEGPWTWARNEQDLPTSVTRPSEDTIAHQTPEPMVRPIGQDLDSGWWMGMTDGQVRTHTLLVGELGSGRDTVLAGWVVEAMRRGHGAIWLCAHEHRRARAIEERLNEQATLCWRDKDRLTLNLSGQPDAPCSRHVRFDLLATMSSGTLLEMFITLMIAGNDNDMWLGRRIFMLSSVFMALVWERDHDDVPLSLARIQEGLDLTTLHTWSLQEHWPRHVVESLRAYLLSLPRCKEYLENPVGDFPTVVKEQHGYLSGRVSEMIESLLPFEDRLFNTTDPERKTWDEVMHPSNVLLVQLGETLNTSSIVSQALVSALKTSLGQGLGQSLEDGQDTIIESSTLSALRSLWVFDNVSPALIRGASVMPAHARALGIGMVCAVDRLDHLQTTAWTEDEFTSFVGNLNTQVFLRQSEPGLLSEMWPMWLPKERVVLNGPETTAQPREKPPTMDLLRHFAPGEAIVAHKGDWWHVGLMEGMLPKH